MATNPDDYKIVVVLDDDYTYTDIVGSHIVLLPADIDEDVIGEAIDNGEGRWISTEAALIELLKSER